MNSPSRTATAAFLAVLLSGCASVVNGPRQPVGIASAPTGASVSVDGVEIGRTPMIAHLEREREHVVTLSMPGHATREVPLERRVSGWAWGNVMFGGVGLLGVVADRSNGSLYRLSPAALDATLPPLGSGPVLGPGDDAEEIPGSGFEGRVQGSPGDAPSELDTLAVGFSATPGPNGARFVRPDWRYDGRGLYFGVGLAGSSYVPVPLPSFDLGYELDRAGVRLVVPYVIGRYAVEASYALGSAKRTRLYATGGADLLFFDVYEFAGLGVEHNLGGDWFVQLDATTGDRTSDEFYGGSTGSTSRFESDRGSFSALGFKVGIRRR